MSALIRRLLRDSRDTGQKVLLAENLVADLAQVRDLVVVDADEDDAVLSKQVAGQMKARVHHVQPIAVKPAR